MARSVGACAFAAATSKKVTARTEPHTAMTRSRRESRSIFRTPLCSESGEACRIYRRPAGPNAVSGTNTNSFQLWEPGRALGLSIVTTAFDRGDADYAAEFPGSNPYCFSFLYNVVRLMPSCRLVRWRFHWFARRA